MELAIIFVVMLAAFMGAVFYEQKSRERKVRKWIHDSYGKAPEDRELPFEQIKIYWNEFGADISGNESVDDITWNDLEMDKIFARMNTCKSFAGEQVLYARMHKLPEDKTGVLNLEDQIRFYAEHDNVREEVQYLLCRLGKEEVNYYLPMFMSNLDALGSIHVRFYRLMQVLLFLSVIPALVRGEASLLMLTAMVFMVNAVIYALNKVKHEVYMDTLTGIIGIAKSVNEIEKRPGKYTGQMPDHIRCNVKIFEQITRMLVSLQRKKREGMSGDLLGVIHDYLVGATLWDFIVYDKIIRYLTGKQKEFMELFEYLGELEAAVSIASFRESLDFYCVPEFKSDPVLEMTEVYHPLIEHPVCNTVTLDRNCMITGSNASGKSTFIKAVAANVILAQSIHTCMARRLRMPDALVITSMAVRDDLMGGESYYMKEIKYLSRIVKSVKGNRMVICVIDEILRGTNTQERIAASAAILEYLQNQNCLAIVASHDIELTRKLGDSYGYYYFCEQMQDKDIAFDYKIREGVSNTKNAIALLECVGFPEIIIRRARQMNACF